MGAVPLFVFAASSGYGPIRFLSHEIHNEEAVL